MYQTFPCDLPAFGDWLSGATRSALLIARGRAYALRASLTDAALRPQANAIIRRIHQELVARGALGRRIAA
jgi:hypothetical protein